MARNVETKYPLLPLDSIFIVDRPTTTAEKKRQIFFNPRWETSFTPESMAELMLSIRTDELLEPIVVRLAPGHKNKYQLLAGERRLRTIKSLVSKDLACYCSSAKSPARWRPGMIVLHRARFAVVKSQSKDQVNLEWLDVDDQPTGETATVPASKLSPTMPASKVYKTIECKVINDCSDERALRIAMAENGQSQSLTTAEEIAVVERLTEMGLKQDDIAYMMSTNITWVSQTASFRRELPEEAFEKLKDGKMARNVAVNFLSYKSAHRKKLYVEAVKAEEAETAAKVEQHQLAMEEAEDEVDILENVADEADAEGDEKTAKQTRKKAASSKKKADAAKKKKEKVEAEAGTLKQGHVQKGAAAASVKPKKDKMLPRADVLEMIETVETYIADGLIDPICDMKVPKNDLLLVKEVLQGIASGERDPLAMIRTAKVSLNKWSIPDQIAPEDEAVYPDGQNEDDYSDPEFDPEAAEDYYDDDDIVGDSDDGDEDNWE